MDYAWIPGNAEPPEISNERLIKLMQRFTPLVKRPDGKLYKIEIPDPRGQSMLWSPKFCGGPVEFEAVVTTPTVHSCGYYGLFKPSIAEVLAHVPDGVEWGNAFYIQDDFAEIFESGEAHKAKTHFGNIVS